MRSIIGIVVIFAGLAATLVGCNKESVATPTSRTPTPTISANKAIAIAATQLPLRVIERATVQVDDLSGWRVIFHGADTTKEELNWPEDGRNRFETGGSGNVPEGVYRSVAIIVSPSSGDIEARVATNSVFLGRIPPITKIVRTGWGCAR